MWDFSKFGNDTAIISDNGIRLSYADLTYLIEDVHKAVYGRCLIFCLCSNSAGSIAGYAAFIENGFVPALFNANLDRELLENTIDLYKPAYLWVPMEQKDSFIRFERVFSAYGYELLKTTDKTNYELNSELCLLLTTSGSTGSPKLVRQSYKNVRENAKAIVNYLEITGLERPITTLPMNYTYGLSIINSHFMVGATILATEFGLMQKAFWSFFREEGATSFGGVPYTYEMLDRIKIYRMDLPSLRYITQAGGKITPKLHEKFARYAKDKGIKFIVMYGQCEATARMGYLPADKALEKCGSMGIAIPGGTFRLIDEKGNTVLDPDVTGELVYEGDNVTLGYAECIEDLKKGDERKGVLYTGDMARRDKDGYYYIVGRKKRFLKIYGNRVNLDEVDRMVKSKFEDVDMTCSGIDDHVTIFLTDASLADDVKIYVVRKTGLNPAAFKICILDEIPKSDSGKVLYKELEKYLVDGD